MPQQEWYKHWFNSPYYYLLYQHRVTAEAAQFTEQLLPYLRAEPPETILDVACGKGRYSRILAEKGFDITAFDLSETAIQEALHFEQENLHFYLHDMRRPFWINYFDLAFNFFTSFGYFRTRREHDDSIRTIAQSLKPDGYFVIDYLNTHYTAGHLKTTEEKRIDNLHFRISRWQDEDHFFKQVQLQNKEGGLSHLATERVMKFSLGDFTEMLSYQGLQVQEVFGDYALNSYSTKLSPRMIVVAKKVKR